MLLIKLDGGSSQSDG